MMWITVILFLISYFAFAGIAFSQGTESIIGIGHAAGAGGIGGVTGIASLIRGQYQSKGQNSLEERVNGLHSKVDELTRTNVAQDGEKNNLSTQMTDLKSDVRQATAKIDQIQTEIHRMALKFAHAEGALSSTGTYPPSPPHHEELQL